VAPFTLVPLARLFDPTDPVDPDEVAAHADIVSNIITEGLRVRAGDPDDVN
jgi:hypothetical protein